LIFSSRLLAQGTIISCAFGYQDDQLGVDDFGEHQAILAEIKGIIQRKQLFFCHFKENAYLCMEKAQTALRRTTLPPLHNMEQ